MPEGVKRGARRLLENSEEVPEDSSALGAYSL